MPPRQTVEVSPVPVRATNQGGGGGGSFGDKVKQHPIISGTVLAVVAGVGFLLYKHFSSGGSSSANTSTTANTTQSTTSQPYYTGPRHHHFQTGNVTANNGAGTQVQGSVSGGGGGGGSGYTPPVVGTNTGSPNSTSGTGTTPPATTGITQQAWTVPTPLNADTTPNPQQLTSTSTNGATTTLPASQNSTAQLPGNPGQGEPNTSGVSSTPQTRQARRAVALAQRRV